MKPPWGKASCAVRTGKVLDKARSIKIGNQSDYYLVHTVAKITIKHSVGQDPTLGVSLIKRYQVLYGYVRCFEGGAT